jgi:preprotein translocase subunit SecD
MSLYRNPRILLLVFLTILALLGIWQPWNGWKFELRGITKGLDLAGGSRIIIRLQATQATVRLNRPIDPQLTSVAEFRNHLADALLSDVKILDVDTTKNYIKVEIGTWVDENILRGIVENFGELHSISKGTVSSKTMDEVISTLLNRIDPTGLLGVQARPAGTDLILFEIPAMEPEKAKMLIEKEGKLEAFIEDSLVLRGTDIEIVYSVRVREVSGMYQYEVPLRISAEGAKRFAESSQGKAGYPLVIYLDRPVDALLVFDHALIRRLPKVGPPYPLVTEYVRERRQFQAKIDETHSFNLLVHAVPIDPRRLDENDVLLLQEFRKTKSRCILLGDNSTFSSGVLEFLENLFDNRVEFYPQGNMDISEWIFKACGMQSAPRIMESIAGREEREVEITGTRSTESEATREANDLKNILSQRLTAKTAITSTSFIPPRLGREFSEEVQRAALAAVIAISVVLFVRYRDPTIVLLILATMGCELVLTIGAASAVRQTIGMAEIGGILAVIGTGVEHQIIITDEVVRGKIQEYRPRGIRGRVGRAFLTILTAALTTVAAMIMLFFVGFGAMKGFAIVTILGVLIAVVITRPAYGEIINEVFRKRLERFQQTQSSHR